MYSAFVAPALSTSSFLSTFSKTTSVNAVAPVAVPIKMMAEKSASVPFLSKPAALDGKMAGDVGFDPIGFSNIISIEWLRESELKHGRICMLATLGFLVQEIVHLPGAVFSEKLATQAWFTVPRGGLWQILIFCGVCEFILHKGKMTPNNMHADGNEPGALGFDPLNMGKGAALEKYKLNEVKNGRLAMIAIGGFIHQQWIFKQGILEQLTHLKPMTIPNIL